MRLAVTDKVDLLFRAFSDRTRLRILNLLSSRDEICVCDFMRVLELPQAKVSRHLAYLRKAGLVAGRKQQQWMHYRLLPGKVKFHKKLLECLSGCMDEMPMLKNDRKRLRDGCAGGAGKCCE
jgi:ArsR family transcriptional regulator, arsenate/arsenite/antimonite-responsive transcriptional repressor